MTDADAAPCSVGVVVVAAGSGSRLGADVPKAFVRLAGRPLLSYAVATVARLPHLRSLVVVAPAGHADPSDAGDPLWEGVDLPPGTRVVPGGAERTDSVAAGLAAIDDACDVVLVHDAARCLTPLDVFERVVDAVAAVPREPCPGCARRHRQDRRRHRSHHRHPRPRPACARCRRRRASGGRCCSRHTAVVFRATDDAALVERCGDHVVVVDGDPLAFKVTTPDDLDRAERLLARAGTLPA